ncbi:DUF2157 domain-containing protein [Halorubrum vacuolatum]|uniref:Uncharacterized membrane protein n=1 Tax=Halorubrum vacuolatum TaxID=63740 RepID=A0A238WI67_HALVU|nr:DUF2157 domain-containing protein [Halorubrum vacuolatum]SNR45369.1 Uncharacterized membrane protein [Halorubrum vacuolatum]
MDPDDLRTALRRWIDEGVIEESTAERIRAFEDLDEPASVRNSATDEEPLPSTDTESRLITDRRVVVALALMGGVLVAVGIGTFLLERWEEIPVAGRVLALLAVPIGAGGGGYRLRRRAPRTAHGLWLLAVLFAGVSLFQLAELSGVMDTLGSTTAERWLLLAWTALALVVASGLDSRPIATIGVLLGLATSVAAIDPGEPILLVGFYGAAAYVAGAVTSLSWGSVDDSTRPSVRFGSVLRWVGATLAVVALAAPTASGEPPRLDPGTGTALFGVVAVAAAFVALGLGRRTRRVRYGVLPGLVAPVGLAALWTVAASPVGRVPTALFGLACLFGVVVVLVAAAVELQETGLVNVATLGFVLGVLAFLAGPVTDVVSGPLALVFAGVVLLATALAAERGRRAVLARIRAR